MRKRNIIVIGASAGGFEAIRKLVAALPPSLDATIFIVWHIAPDAIGVLPDVLNRYGTIMASPAADKEKILSNHIYVAPPDRHLVLEKDIIRVTHGPRENRFRPAVDPLFRSAAFAYGSRVIGIILSGALDDGTSGLWTVKQRGGIAIVQSPEDAEVPSMPLSALRAVDADYTVPVAEMAALITTLSQQEVATNYQNEPSMDENEKLSLEVRIAIQDEATGKEIFKIGDLTPYTCPECHGVLLQLRDGDIIRFRCHTGHAFSTDSLLASITNNIEESLWNAIRSIEEDTMLLNHLGDHFAEANDPKLAATYFKKAKEAEARALEVRKTVRLHERLTTELVRREAQQEEGDY